MSQLIKLATITAKSLLDFGKTRQQILNELTKLYGNRFDINDNKVFCKDNNGTYIAILQLPERMTALGAAFDEAIKNMVRSYE